MKSVVYLPSGARLSQAFDKVAELSTALEVLPLKQEDSFTLKSNIMTLKNILRGLNKLDVELWMLLSTASGWTVYGAVGLSWCEGGDLQGVWNGWKESGFPLKPLPEYERPARFLNPALMPETRNVRELAQAARGYEHNALAFAAMIAHRDEPLDFTGYTAEKIAEAPPQIACFFLKDLKANRPRVEGLDIDAAITALAAKVQNTEFEV